MLHSAILNCTWYPSKTSHHCKLLYKCCRACCGWTIWAHQTIWSNNLNLQPIEWGMPSTHLPMAFLPWSLLLLFWATCIPSSHGLAMSHQTCIGNFISTMQKMFPWFPAHHFGSWCNIFQKHPRYICEHVDSLAQQQLTSKRPRKKTGHTYTRSCQPPALGIHPHAIPKGWLCHCSSALISMDGSGSMGGHRRHPKRVWALIHLVK